MAGGGGAVAPSSALASIFPGFCWGAGGGGAAGASVIGTEFKAGGLVDLASVVIGVTTGPDELGATGLGAGGCGTGAAPEKINFRPCN